MPSDATGLRKLQQALLNGILDGSPAGDASGESSAEELLQPTAALSARHGLDAYRRMCRTRFCESIAADHPTVRALLGRRRFQSLVAHHLVECPPSGHSLEGLGARLPASLLTWSECETGERGALYDLALLEGTVAAARLSEAPPALPRSQLDGVPSEVWGDLRFTAAPSLRLLNLGHAALEETERFRREGLVRMPAVRPTAVVVVRAAARVHAFSEKPGPFELLRRLVSGESLGRALDQAVDDPPLLWAAFARWARAAVFVGLKLDCRSASVR